MFKMRQIYFLFIAILFFAVSCNNDIRKNKIKEGYIDYCISYEGKQSENSMGFMMPKNMILKFKDNFILTHLESFAGFFFINYF